MGQASQRIFRKGSARINIAYAQEVTHRWSSNVMPNTMCVECIHQACAQRCKIG